MRTLFFGQMYLHHNSVEGEVKYFYTPSYQTMLCTMIKYLVDEKLINADDHDISFSNAVSFITNNEGANVTVEGSSREEDLKDLLDDLTNDNLEDESWFTYKAPGGGVIDLDEFVIMTIGYNENYNDTGYNQAYHTIACKKENVEKEFSYWARGNFDVCAMHLPHNITKTAKILNNRFYEDTSGDRQALDMVFRVEKPLTGEKILGEDII